MRRHKKIAHNQAGHILFKTMVLLFRCSLYRCEKSVKKQLHLYYDCKGEAEMN